MEFERTAESGGKGRRVVDVVEFGVRASRSGMRDEFDERRKKERSLKFENQRLLSTKSE